MGWYSYVMAAMSNSYRKPLAASTSSASQQQGPPPLVPSLPLKFPGLAKQANVDEQGKLLRTSSDSLLKHEAKRGVMPIHNSFERFTASCEDAWDHKIEDKISYLNVKNSSVPAGKLKYGNPASIHIKESRVNNGLNNCEPSSSTLEPQPPNKVDASSSTPDADATPDPKVVKLRKLIYDDEVTDLTELRTITWSGIPDEDRPTAWKLLLGYLPAARSKRANYLANKRAEYQNLVEQYFVNKPEGDDVYRQIHIDIPRMQPLLSIFQQSLVQGIFERILYIWSIRHPASGYVQGMNDLVTPFFLTYLSEHVDTVDRSVEAVKTFQVEQLPPTTLSSIEADVYWSFNKLLDSIQDNYTFAQPGIQRLVNLLIRVISRVDRKLHDHLEANGVEYMQFAFRWMNNLLIREMPLHCIIRLWDTYLSEGSATTNVTRYVTPTSSSSSSGNQHLQQHQQSIESSSASWASNWGTPFSSAFHLFVCAAFLRFWSKSLLQERDFQGLMLKLQNLPTFHWSEKEVQFLVADAYQMKYGFSPNHLRL